MTRVKPSPTSAVVALTAELRAAGRNIISLGAGEPDFPTPEHIREAGKKAIDSGHTRYTPIDGTSELKLAIRAKFARDNSLNYETSQILVSSGAKQTCYNACLAVLGPGEGVTLEAAAENDASAHALLLSGVPLREPVARYGPFVMNTPAEIKEAILDYQAGRMGEIRR